MAKVKITLDYDTETLFLTKPDGIVLTAWGFSEEELDDIIVKDIPKTKGDLSKLTKLRAMNLSVEEIMELKQAGLLDE